VEKYNIQNIVMFLWYSAVLQKVLFYDEIVKIIQGRL